MSTVILTEKPSVAEDIAKSFGANFEKKAGYIVASNGYYVTWAFGHLFELDDSAFKGNKWVLEELPLFPDKFNYRVLTEKKAQFTTISNLLKSADKLIIATDAGREGELIAREIIISAGWNKMETSYRFWTSEALSIDVVKKGLLNAKPLKGYDSLYYSAKARQESDWLVGINLTRLWSLKANGNWSVGRVQTPTLNLIVSRDNTIDKFKPEEYYIVKVLFEKHNIIFEAKYFNVAAGQNDDDTNEESNKFRLTKDNAIQIADIAKAPNTGNVKDVKKETKKQSPPSIHSLTSLQRTANKTYGLSAQQTLDIAQQLYETYKCISYPRTDSNHLAESSIELAQEKLQMFAPHLLGNIHKPGKRVFDSSKLTDHHAIIPLQNYTGSDDKQSKVFELIKRAFIGSFMDDYIYESTTAVITIKQLHFLSIGKKEVQKGWKILFDKDEDEKESKLPELNQGEDVKINKSNFLQQFTKAPARLTEDTLLQQMEKLNLGTPATRASIIERLLKVSYLIRDKKNIISTEKGKELISVLRNSPIISPEMTMEWESRLDSIYTQQKGYSDYSNFIVNIKSFVTEEIVKHKNTEVRTINQATPKMIDLAKKLAKQNNVKGFDFKDTGYELISSFIGEQMKKAQEGIKCSCGGTITVSPKAYNCDGCKKMVWESYFSKRLTQAQVLSLFGGHEVEVKGLKSIKGSIFDAKLKLKDEKGSVDLIYNKR
jgi:DNA topoisomerase-3